MVERDEKITKLTGYFKKRDDVVLAFLFGSQAKEYARPLSDWDIGIYFTPASPRIRELETDREYPAAHQIWADLVKLLEAEVDLLVLNRAKPSLVFSVLNSGKQLLAKNRRLYLRLLIKTYYEAVDFWQFVHLFGRIRERSQSLAPEDRSNLIEHVIFLENEMQDLEQFKKLTQQDYLQDRNKKRNIERWIENLTMAAIDIGTILLSSQKQEVPQTYREVLRALGLYYFDSSFADELAQCAELRNILAHEYLDLRWKQIQDYIVRAQRLYPRLVAKMKEVTKISP